MKIMMKQNTGSLFTALSVCALLLVSSTGVLAEETDGIDIGRDGALLTDAITTHPVDGVQIDTVLVFNNAGEHATRVRCVAFNQHGEAIGRGWLGVPAQGLRYGVVSDLTNGAPLVGSVRCGTHGHVIGSAFLLGPVFSDLPAKHAHRDDGVRIRFPVVAAR